MDAVLYEAQDGVATVSLNRPDVYNAFDLEQSLALQKALKLATEDNKVRVVVLTGSGKGFCSGQDLKSLEGSKIDFEGIIEERYNPIIRAMRGMEKPIICKLNGVAAGAGCSLALACDLIVASENAILVEAFVNVGLIMDSGSSYFLPRLVGSAKAFELSTMGSKIKADEALRLGMINKVVKHEALDAAVEEIVNYYKNAPTLAIGLMKKMINKSFHSDLNTMLEVEKEYQVIAGNSADFKEGVDAFNEKRKPIFQGK